MLTSLKLECIGDDNPIMPKRAWCAEIRLGLDPKYGFKRKFLRGQKDYSEANGPGSRGVYKYYNLEEGKIYEINSPQSWKHDDRYFCRIENGEEVRLEKTEVIECLKKELEETFSMKPTVVLHGSLSDFPGSTFPSPEEKTLPSCFISSCLRPFADGAK
jgi:hypothetical protein